MGFNPAIPRDRAKQPSRAPSPTCSHAARRASRRVGGAIPGRSQRSPTASTTRAATTFRSSGATTACGSRWSIPTRASSRGFSAPILLPSVTPANLHGLSLFGVGDIAGPAGNAAAGRDRPDRGLPGPGRNGLCESARAAAGLRGRRSAGRRRGRRGVGGNRQPVFRRSAHRHLPSTLGKRRLRPGPPAGSARLVHYGADRVVLAASAVRPATVVLSDLWFPGWSATVDGTSADVERVDYLFRGIRVGPGVHRIVLSYRPASWRIARAVTGVALLALIAAVAIAVARRRRAGGGRGRSAFSAVSAARARPPRRAPSRAAPRRCGPAPGGGRTRGATPGWPSVSACSRAACSKALEATSTAGLPADSNSSTSRRPHDTQEPQSASASITASQRCGDLAAHVGGRGLGEGRLGRPLDRVAALAQQRARARRGRRRRAACGCRAARSRAPRRGRRGASGRPPGSRSRGRVEDSSSATAPRSSVTGAEPISPAAQPPKTIENRPASPPA